MHIDEFLKHHMIAKVGINPLNEIIVDDPKGFVRVVRENGYYISEILWWECAEIVSGPRIGHGGTLDPRKPDTHFFAETDLQILFDTILQDEKYDEYFNSIKKEYPNLDLYPGFDIKSLSQD